MAEVQVCDVYGSNAFKWRVSKENPEDTIPYVTLYEYINLTDRIAQEVIYLQKASDYAKNLENGEGVIPAGSIDDVYKGLYDVKPVNKAYRLPYVKLEGYTLQTQYDQIDVKPDTWGGKLQQLTNNFLNYGKYLGDNWDSVQSIWNSWFGENAAKRDRRRGSQIAKQAIKAYGSTNFGKYSTKFSLFNDSADLAKNHNTFIKEMLLANVPEYANIMAQKVPHLFQINIPGVYHIPLGFISNFTARKRIYFLTSAIDGVKLKATRYLHH